MRRLTHQLLLLGFLTHLLFFVPPARAESSGGSKVVGGVVGGILGLAVGGIVGGIIGFSTDDGEGWDLGTGRAAAGIVIGGAVGLALGITAGVLIADVDIPHSSTMLATNDLTRTLQFQLTSRATSPPKMKKTKLNHHQVNLLKLSF